MRSRPSTGKRTETDRMTSRLSTSQPRRHALVRVGGLKPSRVALFTARLRGRYRRGTVSSVLARRIFLRSRAAIAGRSPSARVDRRALNLALKIALETRSAVPFLGTSPRLPELGLRKALESLPAGPIPVRQMLDFTPNRLFVRTAGARPHTQYDDQFVCRPIDRVVRRTVARSEEHTSELQSL